MHKPKREFVLTSACRNASRNAQFNCRMSYIGDIDWNADKTVTARVNDWAQMWVNEMAETETHKAMDCKKFRVYLSDGTISTRTITLEVSIHKAITTQPKSIQQAPHLKVDMDKPFGKSYLASHIHGYLKATAKNMATDTEIAKITSELQTLNAKIKQLEAKRTELESNRKVATNDHDAVAHFGKLLEIAFCGEFVFDVVRDEGYCKVLEFVRNGEIKVLPVSVFMVTEQVTKAHNVASSAIVPMPTIHVLNKSNVMIPVSDLTPKEIMQFLR